MAANMTMAGIGGRVLVKGRRIAMPAVGPTPGRTPTRVPNIQPMNAKNKFCKLKAFEKPCHRKPKEST